MSQPESQQSSQNSDPFVADSLTMGLSVLFVMAIIQRGVGIVRSIGFCSMLDESVLGQWTMAQTFITCVVPIFLLGLPGSIIRFVEHFRLKRQLRQFVRCISIGTACIVVGACCVMMIFPREIAWLTFRDRTVIQPVAALAFAMIMVVFFGFIEQLVSGLRQVRLVSVMQFAVSVSFTVLSICWLLVSRDLVGLIVSFAIASFLGSLPGVMVLMRNWDQLPEGTEAIERSTFVRRIAPYAMSIWAINLSQNVFDMSDRYMILHYAPGGTGVGQALVGEYFSAKLLPVLLLSLGMMIGGVLMPYLTADWERGRVRRVGMRMKQVILVLSCAFTFCAAMGILVAPWLFTYVFQGRYEAGLDVMPIAFMLCAWSSLVMVSQDYLWICEKGILVGAALFVGLACNIGLTMWLLPTMGLLGAVLATSFSNFVVLAIIHLMMWMNRYPLDRSAVFALLLPATLMGGPLVALASLFAVAIASRHARRYLTNMWAQIQGLVAQKIAAAR